MSPRHVSISPKRGQASYHSSSTLPALMLLLLCVSFAEGLYKLPLNRIIERRVCQDYYAEHDPSQAHPVPERLCKIDQVQGKLATIQGIMETTWIVGDFLVTIPLGFVAERYGLRFVLWLNMIPRACLLTWALTVGYFDNILPTKAIIASPFLSVLGGTCVFESLTYALTANLSDDGSKRTTHLAYISSISYIVNLLGPAAAAFFMSILIWLPLLLGLILLAIAALSIRYLPTHINRTSPDASPESNPLLSRPPTVRMSSTIKSTISHLISLISSNSNLRILLSTFVLTAVAGSTTPVLLQYISLRYGWTFASAGYLLSLKSIVNLLLLTVFVPALMRHATITQRRGPVHVNLFFALVSLAISVAGAACIGFASTFPVLMTGLIIYALGSALPVFKYSLLRATCVSGPIVGAGNAQAHQTQLFSIAMLSKTLGSLLGAPFMAALWVRGIKLGGAALGLPYFLSAGFYALAMGAMWTMRLEEEQHVGREE